MRRNATRVKMCSLRQSRIHITNRCLEIKIIIVVVIVVIIIIIIVIIVDIGDLVFPLLSDVLNAPVVCPAPRLGFRIPPS